MKANRYLCYVVRPPRYKKSISELFKGNPRHLIENFRLRKLYFLGFRYPGKYSALLMKHMIYKAGIDHLTYNLQGLLLEAFYLNATAMIVPITISPIHNFGKTINNSIEEYYHLSNSYLTTASGERKKLNYIILNDLSQLRGRYRVRVVYLKRITLPEETKKNMVSGRSERAPKTFGVIPKETNKNTIMIRYLDPQHIVDRVVSGLSKNYPAGHLYHEKAVNLELSDQVADAVREVSAKLGIYYCLMCRFPWDEYGPFSPDRMNRHVNDYYLRYPHYRKMCDMIRHFLSAEDLKQRLLEIFPEGSKLYIASSLWKPYEEEHFRPLASSFNIYFCYDFPEIASLGLRENPDTSKLKLIEKSLVSHSVDHLMITYLHIRLNKDMFKRFKLRAN